MKRNLIVLGGVAVLILIGFFAPVLSFPEKLWYMETMETRHILSAANVGMGFIILWFMQSSSKWRGALWIVLSVVGSIMTISQAQQKYERFISSGMRLDPTYTSGKPSHEIGLYLIMLGYIIVIIGSIWDIVQKRRQEHFSRAQSQMEPKERPSY